MSRNPDPCYCEQAQTYENLLELAIESIDNLSRSMGRNPLSKRIEETIEAYKKAQAEYESEG